MTVTYSLSVANTRLCGFAKLLFRWKGSIYKLLYRELLIFCALYYSLSFLYKYGLDEKNKLIFAEICTYCQLFTKFIPLSFVLGFYVTIVVTRWWDQFKCIPWPDRVMMLVSSHLQGTDDRSRMMRRTIARYLVLILTLTFQAVSSSVKKRFPTVDHLQEAGLLTNPERIAYEKVPETHGRWWLPAQWATCILVRARKEKRIKHDILLKQLLHEVMEYRGLCGMIFCYDWISIPLVYTQTVTIATYIYFIAATMARQYVDTPNGSNHNIDSYVPIFTILEFLCYMGWLKVAEQLINPFGEDDDDFELNWCLDRNLFISLQIADELHNQFPILVKDSYWNDEEATLPYTKSSINLRSKAHLGSAINIFVNEEDSEFVPMEPIMEIEKDDYVLSDINDNVSPDVGGYRFNYNMSGKNADLDGVSVSTTGLRIPNSIPGSKFFNLLLGQSNENVNKNVNDRYLYYNSKKDNQNGQIIQPSSQTSGFLQMPINFSNFKNKNKKINVTRSNTTSTNNSMSKLMKSKQRKRSVGTGSLGLKNADSSAAVSRDDLASLQSESLSFGNYKSTPIAYRKYSFRGQTPADDQQSLINFEKFPDLNNLNQLNQLNQINSISSSADSSTNQPNLASYLRSNNLNNASSRFSVYKSQQPSPQPHHLISQLHQKLSHLENNQNSHINQQHQADDTLSQISTISGLQMNPIPNNFIPNSILNTSLDLNNSRINETKITMDEPITQVTSAIFNINNSVNNNSLFTKTPIDTPITTTASRKESTVNQPSSIPITTPLSIKIEDSNDLERTTISPKDHYLNEESIENKTSSSSSNSSDTITNTTTNTIKTVINKDSAENKEINKLKEESKNLDKKSSLDSIYEPNSSQESLSPFQSNQSTVTSFADFLQKKVEGGKQLNDKDSD